MKNGVIRNIAMRKRGWGVAGALTAERYVRGKGR